MHNGAVTTTGRELDLAIDGRGFFVVSTADGPRYTRNGHFTRRSDNVLVTDQGDPLMGDNGPLTLPVGGGAIRMGEGGQLMAGDAEVGKLKIVEFANASGLSRQDGALFRAGAGSTPSAVANPTIVTGAIEQSNVSLVERMAALTEVSRTFEALQRGVTILMNDIDGRAISELGRR